MDSTTVYVLLVIFVATLIRSAFGFGEALVAVPLLAIRLPITTAAPLAVLVSITVAAVIVAQDWRHIHVRSAGWLVVATLFGIPLGLVLLTQGNHRLVKGTLAVIIMAFSAYALIGRRPPELHSDNRLWLLVCGFCAGVLGGAYGMNGPPLAIYGAMRRWSAQHFRATLQGYFLPASVIGMIGYWLAGLWVHRGDSLLSAVVASCHSGDPARAGGKSSTAGRRVSQVCSCGSDLDRDNFTGAGRCLASWFGTSSSAIAARCPQAAFA